MSGWILLRGLTRDGHHWGEFPRRLERAAGDAVLTLDLPGNGVRWQEPSPARVPAMADFCTRELARRGVEPPHHLLALSLGAMVATEWATHRPREIASAVLVNTSMRPFSRLHERLRPAAALRLLGALAAGHSAEAFERTILGLTSWRRARDAALLADWAGWRSRHPVSTRNAVRQLLAAACYRAPTRPPAIPLLILSGARDALVSPRCSQRIAAAWGCRHESHPEAGHDLPLDAPDWLIERIGAWHAGADTGPPRRVVHPVETRLTHE